MLRIRISAPGGLKSCIRKVIMIAAMQEVSAVVFFVVGVVFVVVVVHPRNLTLKFG